MIFNNVPLTQSSLEPTGNGVVLLDLLDLQKCNGVLMNPLLVVQRTWMWPYLAQCGHRPLIGLPMSFKCFFSISTFSVRVLHEEGLRQFVIHGVGHFDVKI